MAKTAGAAPQYHPGSCVLGADGTGMVVTFSVNSSSEWSAGILTAEEGNYVKGKWMPGRMNGDQDHQGRDIRAAVGEWSIQRVKLYQY